jgi:hypothetical protein
MAAEDSRAMVSGVDEDRASKRERERELNFEYGWIRFLVVVCPTLEQVSCCGSIVDGMLIYLYQFFLQVL